MRTVVCDLTGRTFGRLTALRFVGKDSKGSSLWECQCCCGNKTTSYGYKLLNGNTKSCGCYNDDHALTHGYARTRLYLCWIDIKTRINNKNCTWYSEYGGRGITYDIKWENFEGFLEDMLETYEDGLTIDRIDVNGNYCKENCRWTTRTVQSHNRRKTTGCSSKYIGVCLEKRTGKFISEIRKESKRNTLALSIMSIMQQWHMTTGLKNFMETDQTTRSRSNKMKRKKAPRHKLLNEILMQKKCGKHEDKS